MLYEPNKCLTVLEEWHPLVCWGIGQGGIHPVTHTIHKVGGWEELTPPPWSTHLIEEHERKLILVLNEGEGKKKYEKHLQSMNYI